MVLAAMLFSMAAFAQKALDEGFYRIQNNGSGRYLYVRDCVGSISTLGAEMGAIELWPGLDKTISDPGSIIYLSKQGGNKYDLTSQGTGVNALTGFTMAINYDGNFCQVYASGQYLYETGVSDFDPDKGRIGAKTSGEMPGKTQFRLWKVFKVDSATDCYFGFTPSVTAGGKQYAPFYADFAYTPKNGQKTWYVKQVDKEHAIAIVGEVTGTVAKGQPVFVECTAATPAANKADIHPDGGNKATGNILSGTYFSNGERSGISHAGKPAAIIPFDAKTMRVLGTNAEGKLAFVSSSNNFEVQEVNINGKWQDNVKCIPHNQSYLTVDADCPATLQVMTESEYQAYLSSLVTEIGKAKIATGVTISAPYSELGKDIPATGGKDRALAKVSYKYVTRTFLSNGTYSDSEASAEQQYEICGNFTADQKNLGTELKERTLVGTSIATGTLKDAEGNALMNESTDFNKLTECQVSAAALEIYQAANAITDYSEVELTLSKDAFDFPEEGGTAQLNTLPYAMQTVTYTSGATRAGSINIQYAVTKACEGFTLEGYTVTAVANEETEEKTDFTVTVTATGEGGKSASKDVHFKQAAKTIIDDGDDDDPKDDPDDNTAIQQIGSNKDVKTYDLSGRQTTNVKGLYIKNNRKYVK